jgi:hypothetical protein
MWAVLTITGANDSQKYILRPALNEKWQTLNQD